jgi:hypothetical protein
MAILLQNRKSNQFIFKQLLPLTIQADLSGIHE